MNLPERVFRIASRRKYRLELVLALVIVAPVIMLTVAAFHWEMLRSFVLWAFILAVLVVLGMVVWAHGEYVNSARLSIDDWGMKLESDVPRFLGAAYQGPWQVEWHEVDRVSPLDSLGLLQIRRKGFASMPLALKILDWIPEESTGLTAPQAPPPANMRSTALWKVLEERGLFSGAPDPRVEAFNFDLAAHPATKAALFAMAALALYWAADGMLAREAWAEWRSKYILPHAAIGFAGALAGLWALRSARAPSPVPFRIAMAVSILLGVTVSLASWSGLIRVNQVLGGPLVEEEYVRNTACDTLLPVKDGLPPIEYTELAKGYWCQFPKDKKHRVLVRKGIGGLYQVDLTQHTAAIKDYRRSTSRAH